MKVLIDYPLTPAAERLLTQQGVDYLLAPQLEQQPLIEWIRDLPEEERAKVDVIVGDALKMDGELFDLVPNLRWLQHFGAGLDGQQRLNWAEIERRNLIVSTSKIQAQSVSELAVAMILSHYKKLPTFYQRKQQRQYNNTPAMEMLYDKTALVIGTGNIGSEIGRKLKVAFQLRVIGLNEDGTVREWFDQMDDISRLDEWLPNVDIVILACPYTESTHHLINQKRLELMKPTALLVNIARGQLVDQQALVAALENHRISGAGLDVFEEEPLKPEDPIWQLDNVIITPHLAGVFPSYSEAMVRAFLVNLPYYQQGRCNQMPSYANNKRY